MKIKYRVTDFRVSELLEEGYLREDGPFSVFRVTKRKLSSPEAAHVLAEQAGVDDAQVAIAGLKDRQGVTVQHMSLPGRHRVRVDERELKIEHIGFADHELSSQDSRGNAFTVVVRSVDARELAILRRNVPTVREHGVPNYFDDQRFGNLRHDQGWIARDLMQGRAEEALQSLLAGPSPFDHERLRAFKSALRKSWGDWRTCRDVAGRFGSHHSVFEYLSAHPGDFGGAFYHVASRLRLIHLFAYQSHVWNRAVAELVRRHVTPAARVLVDCTEGSLVCFEGEAPATLAGRSFRLPGTGLEDVENAEDRAILTEVLAGEGIAPEGFRIDGVPGFQLKGEDRELVVHPRHLRVRPPVDDPDHPGMSALGLRFELPRGAYATLVVKRLFARSQEKRTEYREERSRSFRRGEWIGHGERRGGGADDAPRHDVRRAADVRPEVRRSAAQRGYAGGSRPARDDRSRRAGGDRGERGERGGFLREGERDRSGDWRSSRPSGAIAGPRYGDARGRGDARGANWRGGSSRGSSSREGGERSGGGGRPGDRHGGFGGARDESRGRQSSRPGERRGGDDRGTPWRAGGDRGDRGSDRGRREYDQRGGQRGGGSDWRGRERSPDSRGPRDGGYRAHDGGRGSSWRGGAQSSGQRGGDARRGEDRRGGDRWRGGSQGGSRPRSGGQWSAQGGGDRRGGAQGGNAGRGDWRGGTRGGSQRASGDRPRPQENETSAQPAKENE